MVEIEHNEIIAAQVSGKTQGIADALDAWNQTLFCRRSEPERLH
ncbi:hypothetical protein [Synechococcus sp. CS-1332]|nr:hypothetical protein [Synechococcus sp. CS-1332]